MSEAKPLADWQQRVIDEHAELQERVTKLGAFLHSDRIIGMMAEDVGLLVRQYEAMCRYREALSGRILRFNVGEQQR